MERRLLWRIRPTIRTVLEVLPKKFRPPIQSSSRYIAESAEVAPVLPLLRPSRWVVRRAVFLLLVDAYRNTLNSLDQSAFDKAMEKKQFVKQQYQEFMKWNDRTLKGRLRSAFDNDWITGLETALVRVQLFPNESQRRWSSVGREIYTRSLFRQPRHLSVLPSDYL